jgi:hypothetical protein
LAARVKADPDALRRLLRALIGRGIFRQRRDGRYELTPLAETLRTDAPVSLAGFSRFVGTPEHGPQPSTADCSPGPDFT